MDFRGLCVRWAFKGVLSPTQRFKTQEELLSFVSSNHAKIGNQGPAYT